MTLQAHRFAPAAASSERYGDCPLTVRPDFFLDRRWEWRSGACRAGDHHFEVQLEEGRHLADSLKPVVGPLRNHSVRGAESTHYHVLRRDSPRLPYCLYHEGRRVALAKDAPTVVRFLTWHINRTMIRKSALTHVVLHAAAARRAGVTVLLPGSQERGKSTTVAGLLRSGYDYITDEAVAIQPSTQFVIPFPKALSLDPGSWPLFPECRPHTLGPDTRQWQVPARSLGAREAHEPVPPPRIIVFPTFIPGSGTRLTPLHGADALRELVAATFLFEDDVARNLATLRQLVLGATVARLETGSLDEAVLAIELLVSQNLMGAL